MFCIYPYERAVKAVITAGLMGIELICKYYNTEIYNLSGNLC
jgi:uncharacterized protein YciW